MLKVHIVNPRAQRDSKQSPIEEIKWDIWKIINAKEGMKRGKSRDGTKRKWTAE